MLSELRLFKAVKNLLGAGKNYTGAATNCNVKSGCHRAKNDCLEMASEKKLNRKDLHDLSTRWNTFCMHDEQTYKNPEGQKQKTLINGCLVLQSMRLFSSAEFHFWVLSFKDGYVKQNLGNSWVFNLWVIILAVLLSGKVASSCK